MSPDDASVRAVLGQERQRIEAQVASLAADLAEIVTASQLVATDDEHDPEGATIAFERARVDALLTAARHHLTDLDRADREVTAGGYGVCERCGDPIGAERLAARPTAVRCVGCMAG